MKISDLTRTWPTRPRVVRADESELVHIVERNGEKRTEHFIDRRSLTNCNRLMKWPSEERRWEQYRLCPTCGGEHPKQTFLDAIERGNEWMREMTAERDRKRALEQAEFVAATNWSNLWEQFNQALEDDLILKSESGTVLVPIKKADLAWLRSLLKRMVKRISDKELKSEAEVKAWHRADHLINNVLIND